jgi:U3 small nucleolar RNA-associated protein 16
MESKANGHSNKRRRLSPEQEDSVIEVLSSQQEVPADNVIIQIPATQEQKIGNGVESRAESASSTTDRSAKKSSNHIRFGSEEPALPIRTAKEIEIETVPSTQVQVEEDSESDDDAPEVIDNSVQLLALKVQAQKQKEAKRRQVFLH